MQHICGLFADGRTRNTLQDSNQWLQAPDRHEDWFEKVSLVSQMPQFGSFKIVQAGWSNLGPFWFLVPFSKIHLLRPTIDTKLHVSQEAIKVLLLWFGFMLTEKLVIYSFHWNDNSLNWQKLFIKEHLLKNSKNLTDNWQKGIMDPNETHLVFGDEIYSYQTLHNLWWD